MQAAAAAWVVLPVGVLIGDGLFLGLCVELPMVLGCLPFMQGSSEHRAARSGIVVVAAQSRAAEAGNCERLDEAYGGVIFAMC